jgi:mRNA-degrading endonuclease RelE of RelBE toxin-antitoxin system
MVRFTRQAERDVEELSPRLREKLRETLTEVLAKNPCEGKRLPGDLAGSYACRLTYRDRIVYSLDKERRMLYVERARTHCGE